MFKTSITARLVLLLTLCISGTLLLTTAVEYQVSKDEILAEVESSTQARIISAVNDLEVRLEGIAEATELFAEMLELREYSEEELLIMLREAVDDREDIFGAAVAFEPALSRNPEQGFAAYYYYTEDGHIAFSDLAGSYDYEERDWFTDTRSNGAPLWSEPYYDEGGGNVLMSTYSVPMYRDQDGERHFFGVVTTDISLDTLQRYISRIPLGADGFGFLLSRDGIVMAGRSRDNLMRPLLEILPGTENRSRWQQFLDSTVAGQAISTTLPCVHLRGQCILKMAPLRSTSWPVGAYYSEHEMLAPLREYLKSMVISGGITLLLLLAAVVWVSRRITRPLTELASASGEIATGNFSTALPVVRGSDEMGRLVTAFSMMQENLQDHIRQLEQETASRNRLQGELNAATAIQMSLLPQSGKARVNNRRFGLWAALRPAKSVGGDLYSFSLQEDGRLMLAVGDVSDKGVAAALFMAKAMTLLQQLSRGNMPAEQVMAQLNTELVDGNSNCMFVTLFLGWLDLESLRLSFVSAGHTEPSLLRTEECCSIVQERGPALGLSDDLEFPVNELQLQAGDVFAVFTDGVDEAFNEQNEQFGIERFNQLIQTGRELPIAALGESVFETLDAYAGSTPQSDDIALMLLSLPSYSARFALADGQLCHRVMVWLEQRSLALELGVSSQTELLLVTEEIVSNIEKYAGLSADAVVEVELTWQESDDGLESLCLQISDPGKAFNPFVDGQRAELGLDSDAAPIGGLGVHLLEALTDWQQYQRENGRNVLRLGKTVSSQDGD